MNPPNNPNWLQRNWKWLVPTGCLTVILAVCAFVFGIVFLVFRLMQSSDVYQQAFDKAQRAPALIEAIGAPVEAGYFMSGSIKEEIGASGRATLAIPLSGPKGKATLYVSATKSRGAWTFSRLEAEIESTGRYIDVLHPPD